MARDFHLPGRSPVYAREGMAATSHPLASSRRSTCCKPGGTAADAAVAAVAMLCVVEPAMTGIGGDCFCLVAKPDTPVWGYNGSGRAAPQASTETMLRARACRQIAATSPHAVTVPGAIDAWEAILEGARPLRPRPRAAARHPLRRGRLPGRAARRGRLGALRRQAQAACRARRSTICSTGARRPRATSCELPALAATLEGDRGRGAASVLRRADRRRHRGDRAGRRAGCSTAEDFARASRRGRRRRSRRTIAASTWSSCRRTGRGSPRWCCSTSSSSFDLSKLDPLGRERLHLALEAARLAFAVRDTHIADPAVHARAGRRRCSTRPSRRSSRR